MYKTDTNMHQSTKKHAFCEDDEWKLTIFLSFSSSFLVLNYVLHCRKHKKILWLLDVCTWRSLLYWLVITRPALFKQNWRPIRTGSCDFKQKEEEDCWRSWTVFFWRFIGNIYCMLSTGQHLWIISTSVFAKARCKISL